MFVQDVSKEVYMKYTKSERLVIGEQVYKHELTQRDAMIKYDIGRNTVIRYVKAYKELGGAPIQQVTPKPRAKVQESPADMKVVRTKPSVTNELEEYMAMSKEELIRELILAKANELRAKKGYEVKGVGASKEFVPINNKNSKS